MVTIKDIAKKTGFSVTTVSKTLNNYPDISDRTKKIILAAAKEMGYLPNATARSLVTKKSWTIGVVFEEQTGAGITHPFFGGVLDKFKKYIEEKGYDLLFISQTIAGSPSSSYYTHCLQKGVDGIIILCSFVDVASIRELLESNIPSVIIDHETPLTNCVYTDNYKALYQATEYLIKLGHKKIGHIHGDLLSFVGIERYNGFRQALMDYSVPIRTDFLFHGETYTIQEGYERGVEIAGLNDRPTAIIAASDQLAIGAMQALHERGIRVPEDISLIGFDDIELVRLIKPGLTTIHQDTEKIAFEAAKSLIEQIENPEKKPESIIIDANLIERDTVLPLK